MDAVSNPDFYDGLILGIAAGTLPFIAWLYFAGY